MRLTFSVLFLFICLNSFAQSNSHSVTESGLNGWQAYSEILNGNMRFYEGHQKHPNLDTTKRESLSGGQHPHTIILSCSDSRVPPEEIFDQGLGDIFTVRLAGNVITTEAIASIEYAVDHLGSKLLLVMGHESCGAVGAAINTPKGKSAGSQHLDSLIEKIRNNISSTGYSSASDDKSLRLPVKENVSANLKELLQKSEIVREAVAKKGLVLAQGIYSLKTGHVDFWNIGDNLATPTNEMNINAPKMVEHKIESEEIKEAVFSKKPSQKPAKAPKQTHDSSSNSHH